MRLFLVAALGLLAAACTVSSAASPEARPASNPAGIIVDLTLEPGPDSVVRVVENIQSEQYVVAGDTAAAVRSNLNRLGPYSLVDDRNFDAITRWGMRWSFRYHDAPGACGLQSATIEMVTVTTLPRLSAASRLDPVSLAKWQAYIEALDAHEGRHLSNLRRGVRALQAAIDDSPLMPTCAELGLYLNALGNAYEQAIREADIAYDAETEHGKTEGAVFP